MPSRVPDRKSLSILSVQMDANSLEDHMTTLAGAAAARSGRSMLLLCTLFLLSQPGIQARNAGSAPQVLATGLIAPAKIDVTSRDELVVGERGTGVNDGRLSRVNRLGVVQPLVTGLPSGIDVTGGASGSQGVLVRGCCTIDVSIGQGDTLRFDAPPREVPNPVGPLSPLFSSVLRFTFQRPVEDVSSAFALTVEDQATLADGHTVELQNSSREKVWVQLVADLKDFRSDPVTNVRASNPFAITEGSHKLFSLLLADAGQNSIVEVGPHGVPKTLFRLPPITNPPGVMPPRSDAVPTSVRHYRGTKYLVGLLTGVPFVTGSASIQMVDVASRKTWTLIAGLTTVTDVLVVGSQIYVLEISSSLPQGAPGRLLRFRSPTSAPEVVATGLLGGSGLAYSARQKAIFITEAFPGRITKIAL